MGELIICDAGEGLPALPFRLEQDAVWLTRRQQGELFGTTPESS